MAKIIKNQNEPQEQQTNSGCLCVAMALLIVVIVIAMFLGYLFTGSIIIPMLGIIIIAVCIVIFTAGSSSGSYTPPEKAYGIIGEQKTGSILQRFLPADYNIIQNVSVSYNGEECEIDNLVIGESGVFIVEVKHFNGTLFGDCEQYEWVKDKFDPYNNEFITSVKNPIRQVNRQIYILKNYLKANNISVYILGTVYFPDPHTKLNITGEPKNDISVFTYYETQKLIDYIKTGNTKLSDKTIQKITELFNTSSFSVQ